MSVPFIDNIPRNKLKSGSARKYLNQKNVFISKDIIFQRKNRRDNIDFL